METNWDAADAGAVGGVANHIVLPPQTVAKGAAAEQMADDGMPARQADLTTMGMTAKIKVDAGLRRQIGHFRRMYGGDAAPLMGRLQCGKRRVGLESMHIVKAG